MKYFLLIGCFLFLTSCSNGTTSLTGRAEVFPNENSIVIDCSDYLPKTIKPTELIGFSCNVSIDDQTTLRTEDGQTAAFHEIEDGDEVSIILKKSAKISENKESRNLEAKEIILHREEK